MSFEYFPEDQLQELCGHAGETEWLEFKHNDADPQAIGEYISALSNSAAYSGQAYAYLIWGVRDGEREIVGTKFRPDGKGKGNEDLEPWLARLLSPRPDFRFFESELRGRRVVVLRIQRAPGRPVSFSGLEYIRIGSNNKRLSEYPERERALWRGFDETPFEMRVAEARVSESGLEELLDVPAYFELLGRPMPSAGAAALEVLEAEHLLVRSGQCWDITNLGALLIARDVGAFRTIARKLVRVVQYRGPSKLSTIRETEFRSGYATGFETLVRFVNDLLPANEVIQQALRKSVPMYPGLAIRELVANALIHQDFDRTGSGPMLELFDDRVEISNPGDPLVATERFVDMPPRSRNEALASLLRRVGVCEERGSGFDKVVAEVERHQLPAPLIENPAGSTRVVLFAHKELKDMDSSERIRACYLHACLQYVMRQPMSNSTLRARFGVEKRNSSQVSRILKESVEAGFIVPVDPDAAPKLKRYVPSWSVGEGAGRRSGS